MNTKRELEEIAVTGFVIAGSPAAFEALSASEAEAPRCVHCGAWLRDVFITDRGPMGGDCLATLTGNDETRKAFRKLARYLATMQRGEYGMEGHNGAFLRGHGAFRICMVRGEQRPPDAFVNHRNRIELRCIA